MEQHGNTAHVEADKYSFYKTRRRRLDFYWYNKRLSKGREGILISHDGR